MVFPVIYPETVDLQGVASGFGQYDAGSLRPERHTRPDSTLKHPISTLRLATIFPMARRAAIFVRETA